MLVVELLALHYLCLIITTDLTSSSADIRMMVSGGDPGVAGDWSHVLANSPGLASRMLPGNSLDGVHQVALS